VRPLLLTAAAIVALGVAALLLVAKLTAYTPPATDAAPPVAEAPPPAAPPPVVPAGPAGPVPSPTLDVEAIRRELKPAVPGPPVVYGPGPPKPPEGSWEAVPLAARPAAAGPQGAALGRELNELQPRLSACFDEDAQARHGQEKFTTVRDAAPMEDNGATILVLEVEELSGQLRIVDAPVETRGAASDGLIACAQRVLRGHTVAAPGSAAGKRHRALFPLQP
jgi:hypothetical protein